MCSRSRGPVSVIRTFAIDAVGRLVGGVPIVLGAQHEPGLLGIAGRVLREDAAGLDDRAKALAVLEQAVVDLTAAERAPWRQHLLDLARARRLDCALGPARGSRRDGCAVASASHANTSTKPRSPFLHLSGTALKEWSRRRNGAMKKNARSTTWSSHRSPVAVADSVAGPGSKRSVLLCRESPGAVYSTFHSTPSVDVSRCDRRRPRRNGRPRR